MSYKRRTIFIMSLLAIGNLLLWGLALFTFWNFTLLLGTAGLAYSFGLRHAVDADHISAIDNVTRKLMQEGKRPMLVGFFFSLGHSTIVVLLSIGIALTASGIQSKFPALEHVGGIVGTSISALFLFSIAIINLLVLKGIAGALIRLKRGEPYDEQSIDQAMRQLGLLGRLLRPVVQLVDRSWKMYFVGFLFGLGFDTATEVGLLGIAAAAATQHLPIWSILVFPLLFTAGMCLLDTADGILMLGAYGWAYVHPIRKLYYNMTITSISVLVALVVGGIEVLGLVGDQMNLQGGFWKAIDSINLGTIGCVILAVFALLWAIWALAVRGQRARLSEA